jgi:methylated-DNA-[protein]-cysteine S-methyltransferase
MPLTQFQKRVYDEVSKIPFGKLSTYKNIATKINSSPRAVGQALKKNDRPRIIPCHRIIKSNKEIGGYFGKNYSEKIKILKEEGHKILNGKLIC